MSQQQPWISPRLNLVFELSANPNLGPPTATGSLPLSAGVGTEVLSKEFAANIGTPTYAKMEYQKNVNYTGGGKILVVDDLAQGKQFAYCGAYAALSKQLQGELFTDKEFPASVSSLVSHPKEYQNAQLFSKFNWKRIKDIYPQGYTLWNEITPTDVVQGILGNCYFLAALSALAENPERIKKIFVEKVVNNQSIYGVHICECGEFREIMIDDLIPINPSTNLPAFTQNKEREIWAMLLEKAWAKINESYEQIEGGIATEVLHDFTGAPVESIFTQDTQPQDMWDILVRCNQQNQIMCCGSVGYNTDQKNLLEGKTKEGLVTRHAYSLIDAIDVPGVERFCKVRNPWGHGEWNGAWNDKDPRWTSALVQKVGFTNDEDGVFFMSFQDFRANFGRVDLCYVHDDYHYTSYKVSQKTGQGIVYRMAIKKQGQYYISLNQPNVREWDSAREDLMQPFLTLVIGKDLGGGRFVNVGQKHGAEKEVWINLNLEVGEYVVYTNVFSNVRREDEDISISSYGVGHGIFTLEPNFTSIVPAFMGQVFCKYGRENKGIKGYSNNDKCLKAQGIEGFYGYIYLLNRSNQWLTSILTFKDISGISAFLPPLAGKDNQVYVGPGQEICLVFVLNPYSSQVSFPSETATFTANKPAGADAMYQAYQNSQGIVPQKQ